ncbi:YjaG family protein [Sansalvadorimonas sp. 2012CJ34-2]|uniref:YjaG family protein n=1 Tax=Parendozoicomonas callyspongiae TaxID=2942213 RepID=A0ABT0PK53_9GAMM|nr:YjaG family protein [Sansalvadorimonas sp. 2012CJ34-2]MCL6271621.1 YjaG family protein [Sansalvadorimonas sp. 2012CJ34-2]
MTDTAYLKDLGKKLQKFQPWKQTAFATAMAQRSLSNFGLFSQVTGFGDLSELKHCLNMLWDHIAGQQSAKNFERLLERLEEQTPDIDDFDMYGVYPALDAIVSLTTAVHCAMQPSADEALSNGELSLSTIGKFLGQTEASELKGTELSQYIDQHPLTLQHLDFIDEVCTLLSKAKPNADMKKKLRELALNDGLSELGISMEE